MLNSTKIPLKKAKIVLKDIGDEAILYNSETKAIHILNKTSAMIWEYCDGKHSLEMIEKQIRDKFQVSSAQDVKNDIRQTLNQLSELGLIEQ
jgi:PqqD family protein of HPr-rel-A system